MDDKPETPDMENIIAATLAAHACEVVYYIGGAGHISCHGCDGNWASFHGFHEHQARAVLAALSEAGAWNGRAAAMVQSDSCQSSPPRKPLTGRRPDSPTTAKPLLESPSRGSVPNEQRTRNREAASLMQGMQSA